jgi:hypothetical protein
MYLENDLRFKSFCGKIVWKFNQSLIRPQFEQKLSLLRSSFFVT